jgi:hypothetical protein
VKAKAVADGNQVNIPEPNTEVKKLLIIIGFY